MSIAHLYTTSDLVAHFTAGLTMQEVAERYSIPRRTVEDALRRWFILHPVTLEGRHR